MAPLAEIIFGWGNREREQEHQAHGSKRANAVAEQLLPEGDQFVFEAHVFLLITLPRPDPGPARSAEEGPDHSQHYELESKPGHDQEGKRLGSEVEAEGRSRIRRAL